MAEVSGYFQAQWDENLQNPITGEYTGWWDRDYDAKSFRDYFGQFISNGVFGSPTNQLKVIPGTGLSVIVTAGWAMINGAYYHNDSDKVITIPANTQSSSRIDSIKLRYSEADRTILALGFTGDTTVQRGDTIYDLKLAEITVLPGAVTISAANILDTRLDESVCGLVIGVLRVETTADLFSQLEGEFDEWFDTVKDQVTGDLAIRLQMEFTELNQNVEDYQADVTQQISNYHSATETQITNYQNNTATQISGYNTNYQQTLNATQQAAETAEGLVEDYVDNDYVIAERELVFTNNVCTIPDSKVTADSLIDVYFTTATIANAARAQIAVESTNGNIVLTAARTPSGTIRATIRVRVR